jgi:hypothetical protein
MQSRVAYPMQAGAAPTPYRRHPVDVHTLALETERGKLVSRDRVPSTPALQVPP